MMESYDEAFEDRDRMLRPELYEEIDLASTAKASPESERGGDSSERNTEQEPRGGVRGTRDKKSSPGDYGGLGAASPDQGSAPGSARSARGLGGFLTGLFGGKKRGADGERKR